MVTASVWVKITPSPAAPTARATHWKPRSRSRVSHMDSPMVMNTWLWMTREARPGEILPCMAM